MAQPTSGTYGFQPAASDMILEAFSRIQIRGTGITTQHMWDARMSSNLLMSEWSVRPGPNLWDVQLFSIPLEQGVAQYPVQPQIVSILDYYLRQFQLTETANLSNAFSTSAASPTVTVQWANHGLSPGSWLSIVVPVSVGGIVLYGLYQVANVLTPNSFTVVASQSATGTISASGVVPYFTTTGASTNVSVNLPNHGLNANQSFAVQVPTNVGGLSLFGVYYVLSVTDANNFVISSPLAAASSASAYENGGAVQVYGQSANVNPEDLVLLPISRTDYSNQPNKAQQARPTCVWWDRSPSGQTSAYLWPVPDDNGPYTLNFYAMTQPQDVGVRAGKTLDVPYRFLDAYGAGLAAKLGWKYPPPPPMTVAALQAEAERTWGVASAQDVENVPIFITPGMSGFYR